MPIAKQWSFKNLLTGEGREAGVIKITLLKQAEIQQCSTQVPAAVITAAIATAIATIVIATVISAVIAAAIAAVIAAVI